MRYTTKYSDARKEVSILNRNFLFLPDNYLKIKIHHLRNVWAYACESDDGTEQFTALNTWYPSYSFFRSVLAHELIHQWQYYRKLKAVHNRDFFSWKRVLEPHGYKIEATY